MEFSQSLGRSLATTCLVLVVSLSSAVAQSAKEFEPAEGQQGKDVIWVPTSQALVNKMLEVAQVTSEDYVVDLGSGDGRTVISAAKRGATALGVEYNPDMVALSQRTAAKEGVSDKATFAKADLFESDFAQATVVTMFLLSELNLRLRPKILDMKPGTRVVSNTFDMGDWTPEETIHANVGCRRYCTGYYWVVPAKVEGTWRLPQGELTLQQKYQMISGTLKSGKVTALVKGKLSGDRITFTAGAMEYTGRVNGNTIEGSSKPVVKESNWQATRAAK
ncbi:MAG: methyltransferase domain-containing protein [Rhizobiales bacterium]|nr:methyltransferase domain-containing protein [Hyphomicrobiales bacterium]